MNWLDDMLDEGLYDYGEDTYFHVNKSHTVSSRSPSACKYCASTEVTWKQDDRGKWRLHDNKTGAPHTCAPYSKNKPQLSPLTYDEVQRALFRALTESVSDHPVWPSDPLHAAAVITKSCGKLNDAILNVSYDTANADVDDVAMLALQTAALMVRFIASLHSYGYVSANLHDQPELLEGNE